MLQIKEDTSIFDLDCNVLVNPVNCVGVMGKGLALQFKIRFPKNYIAYREHCFTDKMKLGKVFVFKENGKTIINFPTKGHWRRPSKIEYIERGLEDMLQYLNKGDCIGMPLIGCGEGKLNTVEVVPLLERYLQPHSSTTYLCMSSRNTFHLLL